METLVGKLVKKVLSLYLVHQIKYVRQHLLHQIKAQEFCTDLGLYQLCLGHTETFRIQGLFKADLIYKDFSRKDSKFKYFSSLCEHFVVLT